MEKLTLSTKLSLEWFFLIDHLHIDDTLGLAQNLTRETTHIQYDLSLNSFLLGREAPLVYILGHHSNAKVFETGCVYKLFTFFTFY